MQLFVSRGNGSVWRAVSSLGSSAEEMIHNYYRQQRPGRDAVVFVREDDGKVRHFAASFFDDPDNDPFYSIRTISPTDYELARTWDYDAFTDSMIDILGNFELDKG